MAGRLLAHELAHLRQPVTRPRFWLESSTGALDHDERSVQTFTSGLVSSAAAPSGPGRLPVMRSAIAGSSAEPPAADQSPAATAGIVDGLPTMAGSAAAVGRSAALQVVSRALSAPGMTSSPDGSGTMSSSASSGGAAGAPAADDGGGGQATSAGDDPSAASPAGASSDQTGAAQTSSSVASAAGTALPDQVIDSLVEALEQRLLAELDRRGGRYSGAF